MIARVFAFGVEPHFSPPFPCSCPLSPFSRSGSLFLTNFGFPEILDTFAEGNQIFGVRLRKYLQPDFLLISACIFGQLRSHWAENGVRGAGNKIWYPQRYSPHFDRNLDFANPPFSFAKAGICFSLPVTMRFCKHSTPFFSHFRRSYLFCGWEDPFVYFPQWNQRQPLRTDIVFSLLLTVEFFRLVLLSFYGKFLRCHDSFPKSAFYPFLRKSHLTHLPLLLYLTSVVVSLSFPNSAFLSSFSRFAFAASFPPANDFRLTVFSMNQFVFMHLFRTGDGPSALLRMLLGCALFLLLSISPFFVTNFRHNTPPIPVELFLSQCRAVSLLGSFQQLKV